MTSLIQISSSNPDFDGNWSKEAVEDEIKEILGRAPESEVEWISWVFGHVFDDMGVEASIMLEAVANSEWITEIKFISPKHDKVHIIKR